MSITPCTNMGKQCGPMCGKYEKCVKELRAERNQPDMQGYTEFIKAFVERMKKDYVTAKSDGVESEQIKKYLLSGGFEALTGVDGNVVLHHLNSERREYLRKKKANENKKEASE